jgi:MFS family permease
LTPAEAWSKFKKYFVLKSTFKKELRMDAYISLEEAERKVFRTTMNDGLWDIFIGCFFLLFAIAPLLSSRLGDFWSSAIFIPFLSVVFLVLWLVRRHIVTPRIGEVKFGLKRQKRLRRFSIIMLFFNVVAFVLGAAVAVTFEVSPVLMPPILFGLIILTLFSTAAYYLEFKRLHLYGFLGGLSPLIGEYLWVNHGASHHGFPIMFGVTSGIMILIGLTIFIRLLRNNPVVRAEFPA